jgi:hypothetical protein
MDFLDNDLNNMSKFSSLAIGPLGGRRQPRHCILRKLADETLSDLATAAVAYNCLSPSSGWDTSFAAGPLEKGHSSDSVCFPAMWRHGGALVSVTSGPQAFWRATVATLVARPHSVILQAGLCGNRVSNEATFHSDTLKCVTFQRATKRYIKFVSEIEYHEKILCEMKTYLN